MKILSVALPLLLVGGLHLFTLKVRPAWEDSLPVGWTTLNRVALAVGLFTTLLSGIAFHSITPIMLFSASLSGGLMGYTFTQSAFTDPAIRRVDRRTLWVSIIVALTVNGGLLMKNNDERMLLVYTVFSIVCFILLFIPHLMGASDARAFLLAVAGSLPIVGLHLFVEGLFGFLLLAIAYSFGAAARGRTGENFAKKLLAKMSLPAVPLILFPFVVIIPLAGFLNA